LVEGGEHGASRTLLTLIQSAQATSACNVQVERIQPTSTFPQSNALDPEHRRKLERKSSTIHPWDVKETIEEIHRRGYYPRASRQQEGRLSTTRWPKILHMCVEGQAHLALASFGAALFYLQRNLIDQEILGMGDVHAYIPPLGSGADEARTGSMKQIASQQEDTMDLDLVPPMTPHAPEQQEPDFQSHQVVAEEIDTNHMALDGTTLQNLEVLTNGKTFTATGSLWSKINFSKTPHGNRMLRAWLLRPLFRKADIERRADAVEELLSGGAAVAISEARNILAKVGDIERLLSRVHSMGGRTEDSGQALAHPNERAVLYESKTHTRRKVGDFSKVLNGLQQATRIPELFEGVDVQSGLLKKVVRPIDKGGCFPDMEKELDFFFQNFDLKAAAEGNFEPSKGFDEAYDDACEALERIHREFEDYKEEMCSNVLRNGHAAKSKWKYINTQPESKDKYFIELPVTVSVPDDFIVKGKR
jgi:DNA mismatch repair protein MSH6